MKKNNSLLPVVLGGTFFAIPYLGLSIGALPSVVMAVLAYGAGELIFNSNKEKKVETKNLYEILSDAKLKNEKIGKIAFLVEHEELRSDIKKINLNITKIIKTIEKKPEKFDKVDNFFSYYLPATIKILSKYDEIENQKLSSVESKEFMEKARETVKTISKAFENQLSNLYESDIIDTGAEMKVFKSMLKADGYDDTNLNIK